MLKKLMILVIGVALFTLMFSSCDLGESHELEGDWDMDTTPAVGPDLDGTFSLNFWQEIEVVGIVFKFYRGDGTLGGIAFDFYVTHNTSDDDFTMTIYDDGADINVADDWMDFYNATYISGAPVTGDYDGEGAYVLNWGTFVATKQ